MGLQAISCIKLENNDKGKLFKILVGDENPTTESYVYKQRNNMYSATLMRKQNVKLVENGRRKNKKESVQRL